MSGGVRSNASKVGRGFALVVLALAAIGLPPAGVAGGDPAPVTFTVTPSTGLVDGDVVHVSASGVEPDAYALVSICATGSTSWERCGADLAGGGVSETGTFGSDGLAYAIHDLSDGTTLDCRVAASCEFKLSAWPPSAGEMVTLATVPADFDPAGPLLPDPTADANPKVGLIDGQAVTVSGTGFEPNGWAPIQQCSPAPPSTPQVCTYLTSSVVDGSGTIDQAVAVRALLRGWGGSSGPVTIDCRTTPTPCRIVVQASRHEIAVPIGFTPDGPLLPPPTLEAQPSTDLADGATVHVTGHGFVPFASVIIQVCRTGSNDCDGNTQVGAPVDAAGELEADVTVFGDFEEFEGRVDCRVAPGCEIRAQDFNEPVPGGVPITFAPAPPSRGRYLDPVFDEIDVIHDVIYRSAINHDGTPVELKIDIYQPRGDRAVQRPAMVWMHGGYFVFGDKSSMSDYATDSARRGFVGVSLQYRLRPAMSTSDLAGIVEAGYDAYDDAAAGIAWLVDHAREYRIDPDAIMAGGYSAGAITAWTLAYMPPDEHSAQSQVAAAVPIAGFSLIEPEAGDVPVIAFQATDDNVVPAALPKSRCAAAMLLLDVCELIEYPTGGHGIVSSQYRDITRRTYDFLATHVLGPLGYLRSGPSFPIGPGPLAPTDPTTSTSTTTSTTSPSPAPDPTDDTTPGPKPGPLTTTTMTATSVGEAGGEAGPASPAVPVAARPSYTG